MGKPGLIAAVDVGTTKVCCAIAHYDPALEGIRILSLGHQVSRGIKKGQIVDMDAVESSILQAVHNAEQLAGETLNSVKTNISGAHLFSEKVDVKLPLSTVVVGDEHLRQILNHETFWPVTPDYEILHVFPLSYQIGTQTGIRDPRGMKGEALVSHVHVVTASQMAMRNTLSSFRRCHLNVDHIVASGIASGYATLVKDEMDLGVTVIDMGGGVTHIASFYEGRCVFTDTIPIGGQHVTQDLARCFGASMIQAERLKNLYGSAITTSLDHKEFLKITTGSQSAHINKAELNAVIQPRVEETFEFVQKSLIKSQLDKLVGRRFVLTGGASQLLGVRELASRLFNKQVRLGKPLRIHGISEGGPAFSTCAGLLLSTLQETSEKPSTDTRWWQRINRWIRN